MKSLWNNSFSEMPINNPKEIIEEQCKLLANMTSSLVFGRISEYDGETHSSYTSAKLLSLNPFESSPFSVQSVLGEVDENNRGKFVYEFFLTSKKTPKYKYRVSFIEYGIEFYPVTVILAESIANEINQNLNTSGYVYSCESEEKFVELLSLILSSKKVTDVISALLTIR